MTVNITNGTFTYGTIGYFRGKAESVELGCFGQKKEPFGGSGYLAVEAKIKASHLAPKVKYVTRTAIDWKKYSKGTIEANGLISYFGPGGKLALSASYEQTKAADLELVKLEITEAPLKKLLNNEAVGARNYLRKEGSDGRIVSEVWVVMKGELAQHFAGAGSGSITATDASAGIEVKASGGSQGSQTITLSKGVTFAYLLQRVKTWNADKSKIEDLEDDKVGIG